MSEIPTLPAALAMVQAMADHRAALTAQCPPPPAPRAADEEQPIHVGTVGAGPSVLLVHGGVQGGLGGGASTFARQHALAARGWRLRLVDRPGFGQSPSRGVDDVEADAPWIADLLGDGSHLVGHSWGGTAALLAAARRPAAVRSLVLVEPALHPLLMSDPAALDDAARADGARRARDTLGARTPAEYAIVLARGLGAVAPGGPNPAAALEANPDAAARSGCALLRARMAPPGVLLGALDAVARAAIPALMISGGWSPTFDAVAALAARRARGRHVVVRSPNHFPQLANADAFNDTLDAFLREAGGAP